jgi:phosphoglycolate phosphatase
MITLIVFDLDGTLVDSRRDLADAANAMIEDLGGQALGEQQVTAMIGDGAAVLVRRALTAAGLDADTPGALDRFLTHYDARLLAHTTPYPGIVDALTALSRDARLAVLTNKPSAATVKLLDGLGLIGWFADVVGGDTPDGRKPDPRGLAGIMRRASRPPSATLLVGDSAVDLATARTAGTHLCLARYGFGYPASGFELGSQDSVIDTPAALPSLVNALNGRKSDQA